MSKTDATYASEDDSASKRRRTHPDNSDYNLSSLPWPRRDVARIRAQPPAPPPRSGAVSRYAAGGPSSCCPRLPFKRAIKITPHAPAGYRCGRGCPAVVSGPSFDPLSLFTSDDPGIDVEDVIKLARTDEKTSDAFDWNDFRWQGFKKYFNGTPNPI